MSSILKYVIQPQMMLLVGAVVSFLGWLLPASTARTKGFQIREELFSRGGLVVAGWYLFLFIFVSFGFWVGKRTCSSINIKKNFTLDNRWPYYLLTILASLGVIYTWGVIFNRLSFPTVMRFISICHFNGFKAALYSDYSIGIFSLRYLVVASGGIAAFNILRKKWASMDCYNILLLVCEAAISHRLSIVLALMIVMVLFVSYNLYDKSKLKYMLFFALIVWIVLSVLNYSRNKGYYLGLGVSNPFLMNYDQIVAYLGSAFQGSLGIGNHFDLFNVGPEFDRIGEITTIGKGLWAYSALYDLLKGSMFQFVSGVGIIFVFSFIMGAIYEYVSGYLAIVYGLFLYCFAELWRIYIFNKGLIVAVFVSTIACVVGGLVIEEFLRKKKSEAPNNI